MTSASNDAGASAPEIIDIGHVGRITNVQVDVLDTLVRSEFIPLSHPSVLAKTGSLSISMPTSLPVLWLRLSARKSWCC